MAAVGAVFASGLISSGDVFAAPANSAFVDDNFYACVVGEYKDESGDSSIVINTDNSVTASSNNLTDAQLASITKLGCGNRYPITDTTGIEKLTGLTGEVNLKGHQFTSIDLSNAKPSDVRLSGGKLTSIKLGANENLTWLDVSNNALTALDTSGLPALHTLYAQNNQIASLDLSNNKAINWIIAYDNNLTELNLVGLSNYNSDKVGELFLDDILVSLGLTANQYGSNYYASMDGLDISFGISGGYTTVANTDSYKYYSYGGSEGACPVDPITYGVIISSCIEITNRANYPGYVQLTSTGVADASLTGLGIDTTKRTYKIIIVPVDSENAESSSSTIGAPKTGIFGGENNGILATISVVTLGAIAAAVFAVRKSYLGVSKRVATKTMGKHKDWK